MEKTQRKTVSAIMLTLLLIGMLTLAFNMQPARSLVPPPEPQWTQTYGGGVAYSVVQTSDGGYALAGWTASIGAGSFDFWLVKADSAGNMEWNHTYGGAGSEVCYCVVQTSDGGYALAGYAPFYPRGYDFWLVKTDSLGIMQWNRTYGGASVERALSVVQTNDGGYALAGLASSFGAGLSDFWLVKTDPAGSMEWNQTYGGTENDQANSVVQTSDGGYAIAGWTTSFGGYYNAWLVKTDGSGIMQWNKTYGGVADDRANSVVQTSDEGYALAGYTQSYGAGDSDFWLVKTDPAGSMEWNQTYGGTGTDVGRAVIQRSNGGYALVGYTTSYGMGYYLYGIPFYDFWLVRTDSAGNMEWNQAYGGTGDDRGYSMVQTNDGGYALAGQTGAYGAPDFWLIKLGPLGPTASFTHSPEKPLINDLVDFNASLSTLGWNDGNEPPIIKYAWDFESDGVIDAYGVTATHPFPATGTYTVTLNITDAQGLWDTETHTIKVTSVETATHDGKSWLANQQNPDGSWGQLGDWTAKTGLVLLKLEAEAIELGLDPFNNNTGSPTYYEYANNVIAGMNYLLSTAVVVSPLPAQVHGLSMDNPDSNCNGQGIRFGYEPHTLVYNTGIALSALAWSTHPNDRSYVIGGVSHTYKQIAQDAVDWLAYAQGDAGNDAGGWSYSALDNNVWVDEPNSYEKWTDNSNSGYAVLGLAFAEDPPFSCTMPQWVRNELNFWITAIQDTSGGTDDGGSWYTPEWPFNHWVNVLKTGNLIFEMAFYGDSPSTLRVQRAVNYLERHWRDLNSDPGWGYSLSVANYQSMFLVEKGLTFMGIKKLDTDGDGIAEDWFIQEPYAVPYQDFAHAIVSQQLPSGGWPRSGYDYYPDAILSTAWAVLTLEKIAPPVGARISVSKFFTDSSWNLLPLDSNGNPKVNVVFAHGKVTGTNPGDVLAWINITNTGALMLQSMRLNETLPVDWTVQPPWIPALGAIHVFFVFANGTSLEITDPSTITVVTGNPETVSLAIPSLNSTAAGKPLAPGESILLYAKISYALKGTVQPVLSYPRNYTNTAFTAAWQQPNYIGNQAASSVTAFFTAYAKLAGDANDDEVVNISDIVAVKSRLGTTSKDSNWVFEYDVNGDGVINVFDIYTVASNWGQTLP